MRHSEPLESRSRGPGNWNRQYGNITFAYTLYPPRRQLVNCDLKAEKGRQNSNFASKRAAISASRLFAVPTCITLHIAFCFSAFLLSPKEKGLISFQLSNMLKELWAGNGLTMYFHGLLFILQIFESWKQTKYEDGEEKYNKSNRYW